MFDFPSSPSEGQIYIPSASGPTYVYTGGIWKFQSQLGIVGTAQTRNRVVNPAMQISQENGDSAGTAVGYWPADQWFSTLSVASGTFSTARQQGGAGIEGARYIAMSSAAGVTLNAGSTVYFRQMIEGLRVADFGWGTAYTKPVVLRFWAYANMAGTYSVRIGNAPTPPTRSFVAQFTLAAATWKEIVIAIPGDTSGTWVTDNTASLLLDFVAAAGSTYVGVTGWQAGNFYAAAGQSNALVAGGNFNITKVGLYLDPDATGVAPPFEVPDYAEELAACMRYWEYQPNIGTFFDGNVTTGISYVAKGQWAVPKRAGPILNAISQYASGFPNTAGAMTVSGVLQFYETRGCNATANGGQFNSAVTGNARM